MSEITIKELTTQEAPPSEPAPAVSRSFYDSIRPPPCQGWATVRAGTSGTLRRTGCATGTSSTRQPAGRPAAA